MNRDLRLRIEGAMLERLIQQALQQGAEFAAVERSGSRVLIIDTDAHSGHILRALCSRYHLDCRILDHRGRSSLMQRLRRRWTLAPGLLLCALICAAVLSRIWLIDVAFTGPCAHLGDARAIHRCLSALDVHAGMSVAGIDANFLKKQLSADAGAYSHIGVRLQGIRLLIEAAPEVPAPEVYQLDSARDLVAAMDGVVCGVKVQSGEACVKVGDTVRRGQLLIRGEEALSKDASSAVAALGQVHVRSWYEGSAESPLRVVRWKPTGRSAVSTRIRLLNLSLPLQRSDGFETARTETETLPIGGLFLPLELVRDTEYELHPLSVQADAKALMARLVPLAQADARSRLSLLGPDTYEITDYWEEYTQTDSNLCVRTVYEITADIAVSRDALIEEVY